MNNLLRDIFGDDDEDEQEQIQPVSTISSSASIVNSDEYEDIHTSVPVLPLPNESAKLLFARLPATMSIQPKPYSRDQYDYEVDPEFLAKLPPSIREKRLQAGPNNIIRWRYKDQSENDDEEVDVLKVDVSSIESNARLVEWSDGSLQIYIGDEPFDVSKQPVPNLHLFAHSSNLLVGCGIINQKLKMKPHSLNSKSTKNLVKNFSAFAPTQSRRSTKVTLVDKDIEIEQEAKSQAAKILEKQKKTLQDSISKTKLTAAFIEEGEEEKPSKQRSRSKPASSGKRKRNNRRAEEEEFDEDNYSGEDEYQFGSGEEEEYNDADSDEDMRKSKKKK